MPSPWWPRQFAKHAECVLANDVHDLCGELPCRTVSRFDPGGTSCEETSPSESIRNEHNLLFPNLVLHPISDAVDIYACGYGQCSQIQPQKSMDVAGDDDHLCDSRHCDLHPYVRQSWHNDADAGVAPDARNAAQFSRKAP